jgi:hypothetical protein
MIALIRDGTAIGSFKAFHQGIIALRTFGLEGDFVEGEREVAVKGKNGRIFFHSKSSPLSTDNRVSALKQGQKITLSSI